MGREREKGWKGSRWWWSFLVPSARQGSRAALLKALLEVFVDGEGDGLAGRDTHDARRDALVEGVHAFLPVELYSVSIYYP